VCSTVGGWVGGVSDSITVQLGRGSIFLGVQRPEFQLASGWE
jgi:hypothetical protein